jgi:hypothetical protein
MDTSAVILSLSLSFSAWILYQQFFSASKDEFPTVPNPKKAENAIVEAIEQGYRLVSPL